MSCPLFLVEGKLKITFSYSLGRESNESFVVSFEPIIRKHCSLLLTINSALFIIFYNKIRQNKKKHLGQ